MWNRNMWPQRNYLQNRHNARPYRVFDNDLNYWCETCDKGFKTPDHLEFHIKLHQKCNIDGCQFVAHPKVITKHIQMQHSTGLFKKIGRLNNPEEIKKWRDERKKKYPTRANVEKKQAEIKEKEKRGERMGLIQRKKNIFNNKGLYNKYKSHTSMLNNKKTENNRKVTVSEKSSKVRKTKIICKVIPPLEDTRKLKPFKGIQDLINEEKMEEDDQAIQSNDTIQDEDYNLNNCDQIDDNSKPKLCGALTSLICNYGCSDDEESSEENTNANNENKTIVKSTSTGFKISVKPIEKLIDTDKLSSIQCHIKSDDDSGPEESQIDKRNLEPDANIPPTKNRKKMIHKKQVIKRVTKLRKKLPSTLLEKLLQNEIQHERNIILQCVRYVVDKKFFE